MSGRHTRCESTTYGPETAKLVSHFGNVRDGESVVSTGWISCWIERRDVSTARARDLVMCHGAKPLTPQPRFYSPWPFKPFSICALSSFLRPAAHVVYYTLCLSSKASHDLLFACLLRPPDMDNASHQDAEITEAAPSPPGVNE